MGASHVGAHDFLKPHSTYVILTKRHGADGEKVQTNVVQGVKSMPIFCALPALQDLKTRQRTRRRTKDLRPRTPSGFSRPFSRMTRSKAIVRMLHGTGPPGVNAARV